MLSSSWNPVWEDIFGSRPWGRYPPEELVVFVSRAFGGVPDRSACALLELGCGPGPNVWYMAREGYRVSGIDGSPTAIQQASRRLAVENLTADLRVADMVTLPFSDASFDAVVDVASVQHNRVAARDAIMKEVLRLLRPRGRFFSLTLGRGSWGDGEGDEIEPGTFEKIREGPGRDAGTLHFMAEVEIPSLLRGFDSFTYERKELTYSERKKKMVYWIISAVR